MRDFQRGDFSVRMSIDEHFMRQAIRQALYAKENGEVPIGAVVICDDEIVAVGYNEVKQSDDATMHAELLAIQRASKQLNTRDLSKCTMYVTLEPCAMCAGACINARIKKVVFGAFDEQFGCLSSRIDLLDGLLTNAIYSVGSILENECKTLLTEFFEERRRR